MKESFETFLFQKLEVNPKSKFLLAVSGGMDSMCLWDLFRRSGLTFIVAHCNFKLRGEASDADEKFVRDYAAGREDVFCTSFDTKTYAKEKSLSIQMAARELRYNWFEEIKEKEACDFVVTAHHLDDQIETFFIQLIRRSSLSAMSGMPVRTSNLIRPLMFTGREGIETYVEEMGVPYREDESNASDVYLRNKIRRNLLPAMQKVLPDFKLSVLELMGNMKQVSESFDQYFEKKKAQLERKEGDLIKLNIEALKQIEFPIIFLEKYLKKLGFTKDASRKLYDVLDGEAGKTFYSTNFRIIKDREDIIILPLALNEDDELKISKADIALSTDFFICGEILPFDESVMEKAAKNIALLDYDVLDESLVFRKWRKGDYFYPLGLGGKKKLSDFFIDRKFSLLQKEKQWIMCSGSDICWIVGHAIDDRYKIRDNTKVVLILEQQ